MKIITDISNFKSSPTTLTIGTFDGVHVGHKKLLSTLKQEAKINGTLATVFTFFPHPRMVLQTDINLKLISSIDEKMELLGKEGIDQVIIYPFSREFATLSAKEYIKKVLLEMLQVKAVIVGYDHRFGKSRTADISVLRTEGQKHGFAVIEISEQQINATNVSSTKIRTALSSGDIQKANAYLGYDYSFSGKVAPGRGLGKELGFPTANIHIAENYKMLPKEGVYAARGLFEKKHLKGMLNIGSKPTIDEEQKFSIEAHWFDFDEDIYGKKITVFPTKLTRLQQKFASLQELKDQLEKDKEEIQGLFTS